MKPEVSIIVVNYNTAELTRQCIDAILRNTQGISYEIIVIDNGSADESTRILRGYVSTLSNFSLIENKKNLGFAKGVNQGIKKATADYVFLLNSDCLVKPGAIKALWQFAKSSSDVGVVGARLLNTDGTIQPSCLRFPTITNAIKEYFFGQKHLFEKYFPSGEKPVVVEALVGAALLITPTALKKVGFLDERYFMYFEDIDYCRRVWKEGLRVYYLPESGIIHHHGASGKNLASQKNQWRRLIPSSKIYHGTVGHYTLNAILWLGQKWQKILGR